ncbi:hypothetical protein [Eggerthia catenaformis]|uniref:hypothetical protein n=1 Tax=Eggerthia catenaformis TaxID=31973 RepID=UPI00248E19AC|nr:hypothetical protein [Eggerthia catenaformis]
MNKPLKNTIAISTLIGLMALTGGTCYSAHKSMNNVFPLEMRKNISNNHQSQKTAEPSNKKAPLGSKPPQMKKQSLNPLYYGVFTAEALAISLAAAYLIMTKGSKKDIKDVLKNKDQKIIAGLTVALLTGGITYVNTKIASVQTNRMTMQVSQNSASASGTVTVSKDKTLTGSYSSSSQDQSVILVNGGTASINNAQIIKKGDTGNIENSEFYGINSGILVQKNSTAIIKNSTINTSSKGSNAVFATGTKAKITISDSTIKTTGSSGSRGLDATYGGSIIGNNLKISTLGQSSATLATDRGEGNIHISNSTLKTNGGGSPLIYSTGNISVNKTTGIANNSQIAVVEGKNSASVRSSTLYANGSGNRNHVDDAGIMIYQSMSGDASSGTGVFSASQSSLNISSTSKYYKTAPMFFITNTNAKINLANTQLNYGSGILLNAAATSEWGKSGSNGATVTLNASSQTLAGNINADKLSSVTLHLKTSSYKGAINNKNTAKNITLTLDKSSSITLTGDTYITSLNDEDTSYSNIHLNGYKLYVNGKALL